MYPLAIAVMGKVPQSYDLFREVLIYTDNGFIALQASTH